MRHTSERTSLPFFGIIAAMKEEVSPLAALLEDKKSSKYAGFSIHMGQLHGVPVVVLECGVGKVNAARGATILLEKFRVDLIINTGSAGGLKEDLCIGDVIVCDKAYYHDVDLTAFGYKLGQLPNMPAVFQADPKLVDQALRGGKSLGLRIFLGSICTADAFVSTNEQLENIRKNFPKAIACEMEGAAVAQICHIYKCPFVILRSLSDIAGVSSNVTFHKFIAKASKNAASLVACLALKSIEHLGKE